MEHRIKTAEILPYIAILFSMLIWSMSGIATKQALVTLTPLTLVTVRFVLAVVFMLIVGLATHSLVKPQKADIKLFIIAGFFQPFLYYVCETYAYQALNSPTVAEVLLSTSPLFAPLFAALILKEKVTRNNLIGIIVSTAGVMTMVLVGNANFAIGSSWGILLAFLAVFTAVGYTIILKKFPARYNALSIVFYVQLSSLIFFLPTWAIVDLPHITTISLNAKATGALLYLSLFSSVIAFVLFCYSVRKIGVTRANAFNNIRPVFTALIMLIFFAEHMPALKWIAMAFVIIGLFICQKQEGTV